MTRLIFSVLVGTFVALAAGCTATTDPEPSPSGPVASQLLSPELVEQRHHLLGITLADETVSDEYGEYTPLRLWGPGRMADIDGALVDPQIADADSFELGQEAQRAATFVIEHWIDSPLVWSDTAQDRRRFWRDVDPYLANVEPFREHFDAAPYGQPFALVDDNRGNWRQDAGLSPAPYGEGLPRIVVLDARLSHVEPAEFSPYTAHRFVFELTYARPVQLEAGAREWERVSGTVGVAMSNAGGYYSNAKVVGLSWSMDSARGHFPDVPEADIPALDRGPSVGDGSLAFVGDLAVALPPAWSADNDLDTARDRGIRLTDPESEDAVFGFFEGPETSLGERAYAFVAVYMPSTARQTPAEAALEEAGLVTPLFWPSRDLGGRIDVPGADDCVVSITDDPHGVDWSRLRLRCELPDGRKLLVAFYVEPGTAADYVGYIHAVTVVAEARAALPER